MTWTLALVIVAGAACNTSFAQTITETTALPPAVVSVQISGEYSGGGIPGAIIYGDGSLSQSGILANGAMETSTATLSQSGATAQLKNSGFAESGGVYYLIVNGPTPTVSLTLSDALLSTSGVNTSISYGYDYQLVASLNIAQATPADVYRSVVGGSAPINGSVNLDGTYTFTTGEPIYIQEQALAIYAYNGSTGIVWSASVDPVISLSSSVADPSAYTFAYSEGAPIFAVPEPSTYLMMLAGLGVLTGVARGHRRERGVLRLAA